MGNGLATNPPTKPVPAPVTAIAPQPRQPGDPDTTFRFRVWHAQPDAANHFLQVETTPAMLTMKRRPRPRDYRLACDNTPASFLPLQPTAADYIFTDAFAAVATGQRYGIRVRVVTSEGAAGTPRDTS